MRSRRSMSSALACWPSELLTGQAPFPQSPVVICGMGGELLIPTSLRGRTQDFPSNR